MKRKLGRAGDTPQQWQSSPVARRLMGLVVVMVLLGAPAVVLRGVCAGQSCARAESVSSEVPFCSLPANLRDGVETGFRTGRSPDVLVAARPPGVVGGTGPAQQQTLWPTVDVTDTHVPLVFSGAGVDPAANISSPSLDDVAPTEASILGLTRAHPEVRSGQAIAGIATGERPTLLLEVVLKGVGSADVNNSKAWRTLRRLISSGAGTLSATTGSLPIDPAAVEATVGTGGLPFQHGITGTAVRNDRGQVEAAWSRGAPLSVIATLADDLDKHYGQDARIGLVSDSLSDRGLIGGNWYLNNDRDDIRIASEVDVVEEARKLLSSGYGDDDVPDLLAVALQGDDRSIDARLDGLLKAARSRQHVAIVVVGTGTSRASDGVTTAAAVEKRIDRSLHQRQPVVLSAGPSGIFLDQRVIAKYHIKQDVILKALTAMKAPGEGKLFDQVFPAIAVEFARYC